MIPAALVLAGSRTGGPDPVARAEGVAHKALVDVAGMPLLARVLRALRDAGVEHLALSADRPEVHSIAYAFSAIPLSAKPTIVESIAAGLAEMGHPLLVVGGDHALLQPEWIADFLARAPHQADVVVLFARREAVDRALPGSRRTWLRLSDGAWTACNIALIRRPDLDGVAALWERIDAARKAPWRLARIFGPGTLLRYLARRLSLAQALEVVSLRAGIVIAAIEAADGRAALDVDKPADLVQARAILQPPSRGD